MAVAVHLELLPESRRSAVRGQQVRHPRVVELAPQVRVNGVAPGGTLDTELRGLAALGQQDRRLGADPDRAQRLAERVPLQVALTAADHAAAYVLLASDSARGTTGSVIHSDGGVGVRP